MSTSETIFVNGDIEFSDLVALIEPLMPPKRETTPFGFAYYSGTSNYHIADAEPLGDYYDDDRGFPLSKFRFDIGADGPGIYGPERQSMAKQVFDLLSSQTDLQLLWLHELSELKASCPTLTATA